jgi:hypothetical protein
MQEHLNSDCQKYMKKAKKFKLPTAIPPLDVKELLVKHLSDDELNSDIDLLRKIFSEENAPEFDNVHNIERNQDDDLNFDLSPRQNNLTLEAKSKHRGIREKYLEKKKKAQTSEVLKKLHTSDRRYKIFKETMTQRATFKIDRSKLPNSITYQQILSARNHLKR